MGTKYHSYTLAILSVPMLGEIRTHDSREYRSNSLLLNYEKHWEYCKVYLKPLIK